MRTPSSNLSFKPAAIAVAFGAACALLSTAALAQDVVVKIGHAGPLSGPQATSGKDNERGVAL
ncbi:MAG: branched chain amino acid transporter substrate-binding protein, partial [Rhodoferax sp.]|nr:branched chain amino acid transporter substrate-binding protein [Rhodoferax sp.]